MTLDNLKFALILNNKMLLNRLKTFMHAHDNMTVLNGLGVDKDNHLLFKDKLVNEQYEITDAEIKAMVDEVIAALDQEGTDPTPTTPDTPTPDPPIIYGYKKTIATADPSARIEYIEGCQGFTPAHMDYGAGTFNYGSWADAFFMKVRPVMLNYDGTVAYELDPNDYTKKKDGTASDVANPDFAGNVMVGIPTIWFKRETIDGVTYVRISNQKVDDTYKAYAHTNASGDIMKYTYLPAYKGIIISGKLRSLSETLPTDRSSVSTLMSAANANNPSGKNLWNIETYADIQMLYDLCVLISKTNNSQQAFGYGVSSVPGSTLDEKESHIQSSGALNNKGLFYGSNTMLDVVKIFGIENFWGNSINIVAGFIYDNNGTYKIKMTYGTQDGSTIIGYNTDGSGYIVPSNFSKMNATDDGSYFTTDGIIKETYTDQYGTRAITFKDSGSNNDFDAWNIYECSRGSCFRNNFETNGVTSILRHGGNITMGYGNGISYVDYGPSLTTNVAWNVGASLSCKPDVEENILIKAS